MRLLWSEEIAGPPVEADMVDYSEAELIIEQTYPDDCVLPDASAESSGWVAVTVVDVEDNVVTRRIRIFGPHFLQDVAPPDPPPDSRVVDTRVGPLTITEQRSGMTAMRWPAESGRYWTSLILGTVNDGELVDLVESVRMTDDAIDLRDWPGFERAAHVRHSSGQDDFLGEVPPSQFRASGQSVDLYAEDGITEDDLWDRVDVGHEFVDVDGRVGFLTSGQDRQLHWVTADGVLVSISYKGPEEWQEALLDIARSVQPVPADDPRLVSIWQDEPPADAGD